MRTQTLAIGGIIVTVVVGLVTLADNFATASTTVHIVVCALIILLILVCAFLYWYAISAEWTTKDVLYELWIEQAGKIGRLRKTTTVRSNRFRGNQLYTHMDISGNGSISYVFDDRLTLASEQMVAHEMILQFRLPRPIEFFRTHTHWLEITYEDAFLEKQESLWIEIDEPVHCIRVEVHFPKDKQPKEDPWCVWQGSGRNKPLAAPSYDHTTQTLSWRQRRWFPTLSRGLYQIWWMW